MSLNNTVNIFILNISREFKIDKNLLKNIWKKTDMIVENHKPIENNENISRIIELDKTFLFKLENVSFGNIPTEIVYNLLKDGRCSSKLIEEQLTHWFPSLTRVEGNKDHDHIDSFGQKYDAKNFTKGGFKFMPSNQIGVGRRFDQEKAHEKAKQLIYICCDIINFPEIRVKFMDGKKLINDYPNCSIPFSKREILFK